MSCNGTVNTLTDNSEPNQADWFIYFKVDRINRNPTNNDHDSDLG
jgi:hypothetical protein